MGYPVLLVLIECCIVTICVVGISLITAERVHLNRLTVDHFLQCSIELVKMNMYQIFDFHYILLSIELAKMNIVYQISLFSSRYIIFAVLF